MKTLALVLTVCGALAGAALAAEVGDYGDGDYPHPPPHDGPRECQACTRERNPVCAVDSNGTQRTYDSECFIGYLNCKEGTNFVLQSKGECEQEGYPVEQNDHMNLLGGDSST